VLQSIFNMENVGMDTNFTLIGQLFQIIEQFTFLPPEAAVHRFSTYLLISFDPITRFQSFFQIVCNLDGYLNLSQFYATNKKTQNWGKVGAEK